MRYLTTVFNKLDYRLSKRVFSRPQYQLNIILHKLHLLQKGKFDKLLDIGGGREARYKPLLKTICQRYINLELEQGSNVDIISSIYKIPLAQSSVDIITLFMVLEHLEEPQAGLRECNRALKKGGYLVLTTVQYWHTHNHPGDFFRYTRQGLEYLCKETGFRVVDVWSMGGPFLVVFHAIELNLPGLWRTIFSIFFYRLFDWLDWIVYKHTDTRRESDSLGWSLIAKKL